MNNKENRKLQLAVEPWQAFALVPWGTAGSSLRSTKCVRHTTAILGPRPAVNETYNSVRNGEGIGNGIQTEELHVLIQCCISTGTMSLNNVAVRSPSNDSFQQQDKLAMTSLHHSTVLYSMGNAGQTSIKKEPLEGGVYSSYHHGLHLDASGQLSYTTPNSEEVPSSRGPASSTDVSAVSSSSPEPEVYTTLTVSTPLMAHQTDHSSHHLHPSEYLGGHEIRGHLMGSGMNNNYMNLSDNKVGSGGVSEMVRAMCGEMEAVEGKELAKLQTVQMEEDMADL